ncbi:MAG: HDOD domain-containing protein [Proteobacteria bacterium]|nr:HDOD domain-containing protein [Pseudomonadota bacterium]
MNNTHELLDDELWFLDDDQDEAAIEASNSFAAKLAEVDGLKTFPVVAQQVLSLLSNSNFDVKEVSGALKEDPSLAAGVLRMANSAFFAGTKPIRSIDQAFVRLGSKTVQEVVATVATMDLFPDSGGVGKQVRDHCAATAAIVQLLAKEFVSKYAEGIFLCGLMHDVGKMLLIESRENDYVLENIDALKPDSSHQEERSLLGYDHAVLGGHVLSRWKLPPPIPKVVAWHHQTTRAYEDPEIRPLVALLRVAGHLDAICRKEPPNYEVLLEKLAEKEDCVKVWLTADDLKSQWQSLLEVRSTALKMFGG